MSSDKFRIAVIGSGPIGKLLTCSAASHPRIEFIQYEAEVLPLRASFGYGIGPQVFHAVEILNPEVGKEIFEKSTKGRVWMHWWHGGVEDKKISDIEVPPGKLFGRLGREELMNILDESLSNLSPPNSIRYGKTLVNIRKSGPHRLVLSFQDGSEEFANAVWAADGLNSTCRRFVQGEAYRPATYTEMIAFRGKVDAVKVSMQLGEAFAQESVCFIGVRGWHVLTFPIERGKYVNIAAFAVEPQEKRFARDEKVTFAQLLSYYPQRNAKVHKVLERAVLDNLQLLYSDTPGGCQRLNLNHLGRLQTLVNPDLCLTLFGDAASAMTPHIAGSMSCGIIGCATFLHEEWNPLIRAKLLPNDSSDLEITIALNAASRSYEAKHLPLAQKLLDLSVEQGSLWSGGITEAETLTVRPQFLWSSADHMR